MPLSVTQLVSLSLSLLQEQVRGYTLPFGPHFPRAEAQLVRGTEEAVPARLRSLHQVSIS
jgi:hypothetical protein